MVNKRLNIVKNPGVGYNFGHTLCNPARNASGCSFTNQIVKENRSPSFSLAVQTKVWTPST